MKLPYGELERADGTRTRAVTADGSDGAEETGLLDPTSKRPFQNHPTGVIITICNQHGGSYRGAGPDPKNEVASGTNGHY